MLGLGFVGPDPSAFRRQVPLLLFTVDFFAPSPRLVVEVGGRYHGEPVTVGIRSDEKLRRVGDRVLRLDANLVRSALPAAVARIAAGLLR